MERQMKRKVKELVKRIESLPEKERLELDRALNQRLERKWFALARIARREAKKRKISMADIDLAIERRRYGL
jgi:hypothetical protein